MELEGGVSVILILYADIEERTTSLSLLTFRTVFCMYPYRYTQTAVQPSNASNIITAFYYF